MGIRNTVTVDSGIDLKRYLLAGVLIFGLIASVGTFLPTNFAFADDDEEDKSNDKLTPREKILQKINPF